MSSTGSCPCQRAVPLIHFIHKCAYVGAHAQDAHPYTYAPPRFWIGQLFVASFKKIRSYIIFQTEINT